MEENIIEKVSVERLKIEKLNEYVNFFFVNSGALVKNVSRMEENYYLYEVEIDSLTYFVKMNIKNIGLSGWKDRPDIRRIQVQSLPSDIETKKNKCFLLVGVCFFEENPIIVCWNANRYVYHKKNRSCYVDVNSISKAFKNGYYFGYDHEREVFACDCKNFSKLIKEYINFNYVEEIEW